MVSLIASATLHNTYYRHLKSRVAGGGGNRSSRKSALINNRNQIKRPGRWNGEMILMTLQWLTALAKDELLLRPNQQKQINICACGWMKRGQREHFPSEA